MTAGTIHPDEERLVLFLYGEAEDGTAIEAHVHACEACQATLGELRRTLAAVDAHVVPERDAEYAARVWAGLQPRLVRPVRAPWHTWFAPRRLALAGAVAVLLVAAFLAGRYSTLPPPRQQAGSAPATPRPLPADEARPPVRDRVLLVAVGDHLERSEMALVEMMNQPAEGPVDISGPQQWARDLVPTNRLIRLTANEAGERVVADVLDDLERVLVEVANSPSRLSAPEFRQMRERVAAQGIVFKIRVLDTQVRQREQAAASRKPGTRL